MIYYNQFDLILNVFKSMCIYGDVVGDSVEDDTFPFTLIARVQFKCIIKVPRDSIYYIRKDTI